MNLVVWSSVRPCSADLLVHLFNEQLVTMKQCLRTRVIIDSSLNLKIFTGKFPHLVSTWNYYSCKIIFVGFSLIFISELLTLLNSCLLILLNLYFADISNR